MWFRTESVFDTNGCILSFFFWRFSSGEIIARKYNGCHCFVAILQNTSVLTRPRIGRTWPAAKQAPHRVITVLGAARGSERRCRTCYFSRKPETKSIRGNHGYGNRSRDKLFIHPSKCSTSQHLHIYLALPLPLPLLTTETCQTNAKQ